MGIEHITSITIIIIITTTTTFIIIIITINTINFSSIDLLFLTSLLLNRVIDILRHVCLDKYDILLQYVLLSIYKDIKYKKKAYATCITRSLWHHSLQASRTSSHQLAHSTHGSKTLDVGFLCPLPTSPHQPCPWSPSSRI